MTSIRPLLGPDRRHTGRAAFHLAVHRPSHPSPASSRSETDPALERNLRPPPSPGVHQPRRAKSAAHGPGNAPRCPLRTSSAPCGNCTTAPATSSARTCPSVGPTPRGGRSRSVAARGGETAREPRHAGGSRAAVAGPALHAQPAGPFVRCARPGADPARWHGGRAGGPGAPCPAGRVRRGGPARLRLRLHVRVLRVRRHARPQPRRSGSRAHPPAQPRAAPIRSPNASAPCALHHTLFTSSPSLCPVPAVPPPTGSTPTGVTSRSSSTPAQAERDWLSAAIPGRCRLWRCMARLRLRTGAAP